jgi:hypothetical protein
MGTHCNMGFPKMQALFYKLSKNPIIPENPPAGEDRRPSW